jgi:ABC-type antimicrobial peptide transport system permease subunit
MHQRTLIRRGLTFHWRSHLGVLLGVVVGTAVLTGALVIGDSLRGSLRDLTLQRLGHIDHAILGERFFNDDLGDELRKRDPSPATVEHCAPVILLRGSVIQRDEQGDVRRRVGRVHVVGVDERFWPLFDEQRAELANHLLINEPLARELAVGLGALLEVRLERPQAVPTDSIVGRPVQDVGIQIEASPIQDVLPGDAGSGRFSLNAQQDRPFTLFVALRRLQLRLRESMNAANLANALLIRGPDNHKLDLLVRSTVRLEDLGLRLRPDASGKRYLSLETRRMLLEPRVIDAAESLAVAGQIDALPTLTYLANQIRRQDRFVPYSTITGLNPALSGTWGAFTLVDGGTPRPLADDEILLNDWLAEDLWPDKDWAKEIGKPVITITYFVEGEGWLLKEESVSLKLAGVVRLTGAVADPTLTPEFPSMKGTSVRDWDPPFPREQWHREWVRPRDDRYWREHRATPKAFVSPTLAQKLWKSRHGQFTSVRIAATDTSSLEQVESRVRTQLREALPPETMGLRLQPVKAQGLAAAGSSTAEMFGWLFLGFSSFLIAAAAMLVGLLFRLGIERRAKEVGLLLAQGFPLATVRRLLLTEALGVSVLGGLIGVGVAIAYAAGLLRLLQSAWSDSLHASFLQLHVAVWEPQYLPLPFPSLLVGLILSLAVALGAILWALRSLSRLSPRLLLAGQTEQPLLSDAKRGSRSGLVMALVFLLAALGLAAASFYVSAAAAPPLFFGGGACLLVGLLLAARLWLGGRRGLSVHGQGLPALVRLGAGNAGRHRGRSLLTMGLLASATFLVVAVESFRKSSGAAAGGEPDRQGGTGGFALIAEADVPLFQVPDTNAARNQLLADVPAIARLRLNDTLRTTPMFGLRVRPGDDVSCLNLYQPQQPRMLGVPRALRQRGGFSFAELDQPSSDEQRNPWLILERPLPENRVPVVLDAHTAQWVLKKSVGDEWNITDERGQQVTLRLVGLLSGSLFQSELLIADEPFRRLFPSRQGYAFFLIEAPPGNAAAVRYALEQAMGERFGLTATDARQRLAAYHAVENTYLTTFQALGGLGVLLGTLGLAVVLLRNVLERRGELALLRALGYPRRALGLLVLAENGLLVTLGLGVGLLAALVAVAPHLRDRFSDVPWLGITALVGLTLLVGLAAGLLAVFATLRTPLLPALRRE